MSKLTKGILWGFLLEGVALLVLTTGYFLLRPYL